MSETILDQYYNLVMEIILVIIFIALKEQRRNESVKAARAVKEMFNVKQKSKKNKEKHMCKLY